MTHLRKKMLEELERRNYSASTVRCYLGVVEDFAGYFQQAPDRLGPDQIRSYQAHLFRDCKLADNTVSQRLAALRFFYLTTLRRSWNQSLTPYPKRARRLPSVLSQEEVARLIDCADSTFHRMLLMPLYATGVRRAERVRLQLAERAGHADDGARLHRIARGHHVAERQARTRARDDRAAPALELVDAGAQRPGRS